MQYTRPHALFRDPLHNTLDKPRTFPLRKHKCQELAESKYTSAEFVCRKVKRNVSGQKLVRFKNHVSGRHGATGSTFDPESRYTLDFLFLRERSYRPPKNRSKESR